MAFNEGDIVRLLTTPWAGLEAVVTSSDDHRTYGTVVSTPPNGNGWYSVDDTIHASTENWDRVTSAAETFPRTITFE